MWTEQLKAEVIRHANERMTLGQIVMAIKGVKSRGSVVKFLIKNGVQLTSDAALARRARARRNPQMTTKYKRVAELLGKEISELETRDAVNSIAALENEHCRWPIGDPYTGPFRFCCAQRLMGSSYCTEHTILSKKGTSKHAEEKPEIRKAEPVRQKPVSKVSKTAAPVFHFVLSVVPGGVGASPCGGTSSRRKANRSPV